MGVLYPLMAVAFALKVSPVVAPTDGWVVLPLYQPIGVDGFFIGTVAVEPTLQNLGVLAVIVAIRTLLSFALELEVSGRWPWQRGRDRASGGNP